MASEASQVSLYFDYHATTPVDPEVVAAMLPYFTERFGNPSSKSHAYGWEAADAVENGRRQVARLIGAQPNEIVFTSGATESNALAIRGAAYARRDRGSHVVTVATEHKAVIDTCQRLEREGFTVTWLPVGRDGLVDPDALGDALTDRTTVVSVMLANNETGVIQPLEAIGRLTRARGIVLHTDAVQAAGRIPVDVNALQVDLASVTAHKMYGPKGVGALYVRRRNPKVALTPLVDGGGQERGIRPGTLNVPGIVGFGKAAEVCSERMAGEMTRLARLRDALLDGLRARVDGLHVNGSLDHRLPNNLNVAFEDVSGDALMTGLGALAVSSGSACKSASVEPSHVLSAMGIPADLATASIRFGLGRGTRDEDIAIAIDTVAVTVARLRGLSPFARSS
jgi:cysteine desulfurase